MRPIISSTSSPSTRSIHLAVYTFNKFPEKTNFPTNHFTSFSTTISTTVWLSYNTCLGIDLTLVWNCCVTECLSALVISLTQVSLRPFAEAVANNRFLVPNRCHFGGFVSPCLTILLPFSFWFRRKNPFVPNNKNSTVLYHLPTTSRFSFDAAHLPPIPLLHSTRLCKETLVFIVVAAGR